jgi:hypothetical protein
MGARGAVAAVEACAGAVLRDEAVGSSCLRQQIGAATKGIDEWTKGIGEWP